MERRLERQIILDLFGRRGPFPRHRLNFTGPPAPGEVITPPTSRRFGLFVINDSNYDDIPANVIRFAGEPAYEMFVSLAQITQQKVTAWRAAFPGAQLIGYLILFNLEAEPTPTSMYLSLVPSLPDLWLRRQSDNAKVLLSGLFGYYFWTVSAIDTFLLPWLQRSGPLLDWLTKWDGFYLDNFQWQPGYRMFEGLIDVHGPLKVNGVAKSAEDLVADYNAVSANMTARMRTVMAAGKLLIRNAAAYSDQAGDVPILCSDPNCNGCNWEPTENANAATVFSNPVWIDPEWGFQHVRDTAQWIEIQALTWPEGQLFMQDATLPGRLP